MPTTVLIGERDTFSEAERRRADEHLEDVRVIDTDHFIIFRYPEVAAQLVLEASGPRLDVLDGAVIAKKNSVVSRLTCGRRIYCSRLPIR